MAASKKPIDTRGRKQSAATKCPICESATDHEYRPFCSSRCADVDLGRWLGERYVVPDQAVNEDDDWSSDGNEADGMSPRGPLH